MNNLQKYLILSLAGFLGGISLGTLGQSSSIVIVPIITIFALITDYNKAIGTALFSILPMFAYTVYKYYSNNNVILVDGIYLAIVAFLSSYIGMELKSKLSIKQLKLGTAVMYLLLSMYWFHNSFT